MTTLLRQKLARRLAEARGLDQHPSKQNADVQNSKPERTIPPLTNLTDIPLSHAQERMWFLHQLDPSASAYNVCVLWHLRGNLDAQALKGSAERLAKRHSVLRTVYRTNEHGQARQTVLPDLPPQWQRENLRNLAPDQRDTRLHEIAQEACTRPFDLSNRSTLRLILVALSDQHHVLIMVGQHIVWDGPSFGVFSQDLAKGYNLLRKGETDTYPLPPTQYIEFADWHRRKWQEDSTQRRAEQDFWESQLKPLPEALDFPLDFERKSGNDEAGDWCTESLDAGTTATLLALAGQEELTPFEVVIATIALLMTRLGRASEITIGTVASHRNLPELNGVIGNYGNVVPLRLSVSGRLSFRQLLQHSAKRCRAAFAHADVPFEYLLDHLDISRGDTRNALLDTMVTFLSHGMEAPKMDGLEVQWQKHFNGTSQIDLSFDALLQDGRLQLQATWRKSLFRPATVRNHLHRLANILRTCVAEPDLPIAQHSILVEGEREQLLQSWGARKALPTTFTTLVDWFEHTAATQGNAIAVSQALSDTTSMDVGDVNSEPQLSFEDLNGRANVLARWLISRNVGPEERVAIILPRKPEWFVAMLAILKAGASFVPIDPEYPQDYKTRVLTLAQPRLSFVDAETAAAAGEMQLPGCISLNEAEQSARHNEPSQHNVLDSERVQPLLAQHPVCNVFTSGSSGQPKGVVVPHIALVNLLSSHKEDLYKEATKLSGHQQLQVGHAWSLAFDAAWQPTLWMFEGHHVHLFDTDVMKDPLALAREIIQRKLDFIELTPGMLDEVLPWLQSGLTLANGQRLPCHVPSILGFGGEAVKHALWQRIVSLDGTTGFNLYGPTEATVDAMISRADKNDSPNIGGPVAGANAYVLDAYLQLSPPGVSGELAISGEGLARGYLGRGDLTAAHFIANPYGPPGSRLYRTGDRVRWLSEGVLEYIGRIDEQVKIRGFRVEPLEVEASIEKIVGYPCAVVSRKSNAGVMQLLCFVETGHGTDVVASEDVQTCPTPESLLEKCAATLPAHLLPKHIIHIERLPHLPNGKIHRRALVMPTELESVQGRAPRNTLERQLCELMAEVLGHDKVNIDDGFFELGGDSISVVRFVSRAQREGINLSARQIFDGRTAAQLASKLQSHNAEDADANKVVLHDTDDHGDVPPTALMTRYLHSGVPLRRFAQIVSVPLPKILKHEELEIILAALVAHHSMLRARLKQTPNTHPLLEIPALQSSEKDDSNNKASDKIDIPYFNLRTESQAANSDNDSDDTAEKLSPPALAQKLCDQLDPAQGHMLAAAHVMDGNGIPSLWLAVNHLVIDASSWHILIGDLALAHRLLIKRERMTLPPVPTAWRNWSASLQNKEGDNPSNVHISGADAHSSSFGTLAEATNISWVLPPLNNECPAAAAARRLGLPLAKALPAFIALAALRSGLVPERCQQNIYLLIEGHGRETNTPDQDLSRTIGWFAHEQRLLLDQPSSTDDSDKAFLQHWCSTILADEDNSKTNSVINNAWQLGFNFLGELGIGDQHDEWVPQPRLDLIINACGSDWPLLHNFNVNAIYRQKEGVRALHFDALGPQSEVSQAALTRFFHTLEKLIGNVTKLESLAQTQTYDAKPREMTPLQYDMLMHGQGKYDPWTTQMEISLVASHEKPLSASSLKSSAQKLLMRHEALRAGFSFATASTNIKEDVLVDWQSEDWSSKSPEWQSEQLQHYRVEWKQHRFQLDKPPLLRFMALQQSEHRWRLLINCHHLLLDGWSVPRILHEWLGGACGLSIEQTSAEQEASSQQPILTWGNWLDWMQTQDRSAAWRYWNQSLQGLPEPSLISPERTERVPSEDLTKTLTLSESKMLQINVGAAGVSPAVLYQLAWAHTLAKTLGQSDVVFGLFDSGRAHGPEGLESLVGLATQLIPLRIKTNSPLAISEQLRQIQQRSFEWQSMTPVRFDYLEPARRFGEFFDTLLVVENALDADTEMASTSPLSMLEEQRFSDSIGQAVGMFVYPGESIQLRLCYDPQAFGIEAAHSLLESYKHNLQTLSHQLNTADEPVSSSDSI